MKVLVTGGDGFVGPWLIRQLRAEGHAVVAAVRPGGAPGRIPARTATIDLELAEPASVTALVRCEPEGVIHLAAVASGSEALGDPGHTWDVNTVGTARLAETFGRYRRAGHGDPAVLVVSTAEVYGAGPPRPRREDDVPQPCSPYGGSKLGAEIAALEVHRRMGLRVMVARAFSHTGPGQDDRFVVPAFARRLLAAKQARAPAIKVGNLDPVREMLHVADVVRAYVGLLEKGVAGEVYNVATGRGIRLADLLDQLMNVVGHRVVPESDPHLLRPADIPHLVGDGSKLAATTGWTPEYSLEHLLREVVDAEAN